MAGAGPRAMARDVADVARDSERVRDSDRSSPTADGRGACGLAWDSDSDSERSSSRPVAARGPVPSVDGAARPHLPWARAVLGREGRVPGPGIPCLDAARSPPSTSWHEGTWWAGPADGDDEAGEDVQGGTGGALARSPDNGGGWNDWGRAGVDGRGRRRDLQRSMDELRDMVSFTRTRTHMHTRTRAHKHVRTHAQAHTRTHARHRRKCAHGRDACVPARRACRAEERRREGAAGVRRGDERET
jgi:hypothetical protein